MHMPIQHGAEEAALPTEPFTYPEHKQNEFATLLQATLIADRAVVSDIESEGHRVQLDGRTWYDTRPMTDPREHATPVIDMAFEAITYAVARRLASVHPQRPYLLSINARS